MTWVWRLPLNPENSQEIQDNEMTLSCDLLFHAFLRFPPILWNILSIALSIFLLEPYLPSLYLLTCFIEPVALQNKRQKERALYNFILFTDQLGLKQPLPTRNCSYKILLVCWNVWIFDETWEPYASSAEFTKGSYSFKKYRMEIRASWKIHRTTLVSFLTKTKYII